MRLMCPWRFENTSSDGSGGAKPCGTKTLPIASRKIRWRAGRSASVVGRSSTTATIRQFIVARIRRLRARPSTSQTTTVAMSHFGGIYPDGTVNVRTSLFVMNGVVVTIQVACASNVAELQPTPPPVCQAGPVWHETSPLVSQPCAAIETLVIVP